MQNDSDLAQDITFVGFGDDLDDNSDNSSKVYGMRDRGGGKGDSPARSAGFEVIELPLRIAAGDHDV